MLNYYLVIRAVLYNKFFSDLVSGLWWVFRSFCGGFRGNLSKYFCLIKILNELNSLISFRRLFRDFLYWFHFGFEIFRFLDTVKI